jgi:hypothetical protein
MYLEDIVLILDNYIPDDVCDNDYYYCYYNNKEEYDNWFLKYF